MTDGPRPLTLRELAEGLRSPSTPSWRRRFEAPLLAESRLDELGRWLAGAQDSDVPRPLDRTRLVLFAGDHGVAGADVSRWPAGGTLEAVHRVLDGTHPTAALAASLGVPVAVHAVGLDADDDELAGLPAAVRAHVVRRGSGDVRTEDALTTEETEAALRAGAAVADAEIDAGVDLLLLGDLGTAGTTVAAVLIGSCLRKNAIDVVGRGSGIDDDAWMRKTAAVRDAVRRARKLATRPTALLGAVGSADVAAAVGFLLRAASRRTPVLLDGVVGAAAALVASRGVPGAEKWWRLGAASAEPAQQLAADRLKLVPVIDLGAGRGGGTGALAALGVLRAAQVVAAADAALLPPLPDPEPEPEQPAVGVADEAPGVEVVDVVEVDVAVVEVPAGDAPQVTGSDSPSVLPPGEDESSTNPNRA